MREEETRLLNRIADRAVSMAIPDISNKLSLMMDLESAHENMPLRLKDLLDADGKDFHHDIRGIIQNMDRSSFPGKLNPHFEPRFVQLAPKSNASRQND